MQMMGLFGMFNILIYLGLLIFGIYYVITTIKSMKQRNEYLKAIRDELKEQNRTNNNRPEN